MKYSPCSQHQMAPFLGAQAPLGIARVKNNDKNNKITKKF